MAIDHRSGRRHIDRAAQLSIAQQMPDGADHVIDRNPAHPLVAMPLMTAQSQPEWRQKLGQCATVGAEDHPESRVNHPDAGLRAGCAAASQSRHTLTRKVIRGVSRSTRFGQDLVAPVAVDADGGRRDQNLRPGLQPAQRLAQQAGPQHSALLDSAFSGSTSTGCRCSLRPDE